VEVTPWEAECIAVDLEVVDLLEAAASAASAVDPSVVEVPQVRGKTIKKAASIEAAFLLKVVVIRIQRLSRS
jgi:hypothetical protein